MDKFDRIFQLHAILSARRTPIPLEDLLARLECSKPTLHRVIATMRSVLNAPIKATSLGYQYVETQGGSSYELPGLWFTAAELQALAIVQRLLKDLSNGLLEEHITPLAGQLEKLSRHRRLNLGEAAARLRFPALATRAVGPAFQVIASATLQRRKVWFEYHARGSDQRSERTFSRSVSLTTAKAGISMHGTISAMLCVPSPSIEFAVLQFLTKRRRISLSLNWTLTTRALTEFLAGLRTKRQCCCFRRNAHVGLPTSNGIRSSKAPIARMDDMN
jgi:hypothetical protein